MGSSTGARPWFGSVIRESAAACGVDRRRAGAGAGALAVPLAGLLAVGVVVAEEPGGPCPAQADKPIAASTAMSKAREHDRNIAPGMGEVVAFNIAKETAEGRAVSLLGIPADITVARASPRVGDWVESGVEKRFGVIGGVEAPAGGDRERETRLARLGGRVLRLRERSSAASTRPLGLGSAEPIVGGSPARGVSEPVPTYPAVVWMGACDVAARLRRAASRVIRWLEPAGRRVGTGLLRRPRLRTALNNAYERPGRLLAKLVTRLLPAATITTPFIWRARLPSGELLMPVTPDLQRSWTNALVWRWPPNLPMRRLYGAYLPCRRAQGTLLDVGANDGSHTWMFSLAGWQCIAFEPQPSCVTYLQRIATLNQFTHLAVEQSAVGDRAAASVDFYVSASSWFSSVDPEQVARFEAPERIAVKMITLDAYCQEHRVAPNCIKIDVEGHELHVLLGAKDVLARTKPDLVVEVSADRDTRDGIWELLVPLDYRVYAVVRGGLRPILTSEAFRVVAFGDAYIDAFFTADVELAKQLEATLSHP